VDDHALQNTDHDAHLDAMGDRYRIRVADDGATIGLWRR
jgi:hypothetical protein